MEAYLGRCLESLLITELDTLEVIVVNDGSHDSTSEIAHQFADKYPGTFRVIDKTNGNYGSCINAALPTVTARYVRLLDADDYYDTVALRDFVHALRDIDADAVFTGYRVVDTNGRTSCPVYSMMKLDIEYGRIYALNDIKTRFVNPSVQVQMHEVTFKTKLLKQIGYRQLEGVSYSDSQWAIIPLAYCHTTCFVNLSIYCYFTGRSGQTMTAEHLKRHYSDMLKVNQAMVAFCENTDVVNPDILVNQVANRHISAFNRALLNCDHESITSFREFDKTLPNSLYKTAEKYRYLRYYRRLGCPNSLAVAYLWRFLTFLNSNLRTWFAK